MIKGFFSLEDDAFQKNVRKVRAKSSSSVSRSSARKAASKSGLTCENCGLYKGCDSPYMLPSGNGEKKVLFLAEGPGADEDREGTQLIGDAGQLLREILEDLDFDLDFDAWKDNAVRCRPPKNREPKVKELNCCRVKVFENIRELKPKKIILLGKSAIRSFLAHRTTNIGGVSKWVGWKIPDQEVKAWVFPTYHPSFLLRNQTEQLKKLFTKHLKDALEWSIPFPDYGDEKSKITVITELEEAKRYLIYLKTNKPNHLSLDFETTGLKPHLKEIHKIITISFSTGRNSAVAFPYFKDPQFLKLLKDILTDPEILKSAQNLRMEESWARNILGYCIEGWNWDTMISSHVENNSRGTTGLKFKTYVKYGTIGYDDEVSKYLKAKKEDGANGVNKLEEYFEKNPEKVLLYNGMDSMFTYRIQEDHRVELEERGLIDQFNFFMEGTFAFTDVHENGIYSDSYYYETQGAHLQKRIDRVMNNIQSCEEVDKWRKRRDKDFNPKSDQQLVDLFYNVLGYKTKRLTSKENFSVDQEALKAIGTPFSDLIINYRTLYKMKNTYVDGFLKETIENLIHPYFNLHIVSTYRSSSSDPNFQNIPKRDKALQKLVRSGLIPRPGRMLVEVDYSGIEVRISTCYHKDPVMINYINDPNTDMHRDVACDLFLLTEDQVTKMIRFAAKNEFVFAQFYGSYYEQCAPGLWNYVLTENIVDGTPLKDHLRRKGIRTYNDFLEHVEEVECSFWHEKFKVYNKWKEDFWKEYQENLFLKIHTGFICSGLMKKNEVLNYPIQGGAFHCLLWSLIHLNKYLKENNLNSMIVGQIHDSIVLDVDVNEWPYLKGVINRIMCEDIKKDFKWIIVPLKVEAEASKIDGNWFDMSEISLIGT